MTVVIRYHTPFLGNKQDPLILLFVLGKYVSLRSVLVFPSLLAMGATLNLPLGKLICLELNFTFPLFLDPPGMDFPDGVSFPDSKVSISRGIPSKLNALIRYTAMDGDTASITSKTTPSDDVVVHNSFFQGTVSRILSLAFVSKSFRQTYSIPIAHLKIQMREGDLAIVTNNSELPRLNLDSKLRSNLQLYSKLHLPSCTLPLFLLTVVT